MIFISLLSPLMPRARLYAMPCFRAAFRCRAIAADTPPSAATSPPCFASVRCHYAADIDAAVVYAAYFAFFRFCYIRAPLMRRCHASASHVFHVILRR